MCLHYVCSVDLRRPSAYDASVRSCWCMWVQFYSGCNSHTFEMIIWCGQVTKTFSMLSRLIVTETQSDSSVSTDYRVPVLRPHPLCLHSYLCTRVKAKCEVNFLSCRVVILLQWQTLSTNTHISTHSTQSCVRGPSLNSERLQGHILPQCGRAVTSTCCQQHAGMLANTVGWKLQDGLLSLRDIIHIKCMCCVSDY